MHQHLCCTVGDAVSNDHVDCLHKLIQAGHDVNRRVNLYCQIPLIQAASCRYKECLKVLIEAGADVNATNFMGGTAILGATCYNDNFCVQLLIDAGADVNGHPEHCAHTPLSAAVSNGNEECVRRLLAKGADPNKANSSGQTPLLIAATNGNLNLVDILLKEGAYVDGEPEHPSDTPLLAAVYNGNMECVRRLLAERADPNKIKPSGQTPLMIAMINGNPDLFDILVEAGADVNWDSEKHQAVRYDNEEYVRRLLAAGADPNKANSSGRTPLMIAATIGNPNLVDILVKKGANVNVRDRLERTALIYCLITTREMPRASAVESRNFSKCATSLIKAGADVNMADKYGHTALMKAAEKGHWDCVQLLIKAGADVNMSDYFNETALMKAVMKENQKCVELLINKGADVNREDRHHETPLMKAAAKGHSMFVELLIEAGADVNMADNSGTTALIKAVRMGNRECVKLLIKAGADVNRDRMLNKALMSEVLIGDFDCMNNLLTAGANAKSPEIETMLPLAALMGNWECAELLAQKGAGMKIDDRFFPLVSPLGNFFGVPDFILELTETCRDEHVRNVNGNVQNKEEERVRVLKMLSSYMLVEACKGGYGAFVDALIRAGVDVNMTDFRSGDTPLIAAARSGSIHCMRSVLRAGADVNISDSHGYNALEVLIETFQRTNCSQTKNCILLLVAAGKMISQSRYNELRHSLLPDDDGDDDDVEKNRKTFKKLRLQLQHNCRATIRKHLLGLDPHQNLFKRIRQLPLPPALMSYLLLDVSLNRGNNNQDNMTEATDVSLKPGDENQDNMNEATDVSLKSGNDSQDSMDDETLLLESVQIKDDKQKTV